MKWADEVENGSTWAGEEQTRAPPKKEAAAEVRTVHLGQQTAFLSKKKERKSCVSIIKKNPPQQIGILLLIYIRKDLDHK